MYPVILYQTNVLYKTKMEKYNKIIEQRKAIITEMKTLEKNEVLKKIF